MATTILNMAFFVDQYYSTVGRQESPLVGTPTIGLMRNRYVLRTFYSISMYEVTALDSSWRLVPLISRHNQQHLHRGMRDFWLNHS